MPIGVCTLRNHLARGDQRSRSFFGWLCRWLFVLCPWIGQEIRILSCNWHWNHTFWGASWASWGAMIGDSCWCIDSLCLFQVSHHHSRHSLIADPASEDSLLMSLVWGWPSWRCGHLHPWARLGNLGGWCRSMLPFPCLLYVFLLYTSKIFGYWMHF